MGYLFKVQMDYVVDKLTGKDTPATNVEMCVCPEPYEVVGGLYKEWFYKEGLYIERLIHNGYTQGLYIGRVKHRKCYT